MQVKGSRGVDASRHVFSVACTYLFQQDTSYRHLGGGGCGAACYLAVAVNVQQHHQSARCLAAVQRTAHLGQGMVEVERDRLLIAQVCDGAAVSIGRIEQIDVLSLRAEGIAHGGLVFRRIRSNGRNARCCVGCGLTCRGRHGQIGCICEKAHIALWPVFQRIVIPCISGAGC